jgi:hypothetical protein
MQIQIHSKINVNINDKIEWKIICREHRYTGGACNICHFAKISRELNGYLKMLKI